MSSFRIILFTCLLIYCAGFASAQETLTYNVNWPSGLSLGEATLTAGMDGDQQTYSFALEAAVPGFAVTEKARAKSTSAFCALELTKEGQRGQRAVGEKTTFDPKKLTAVRETDNGGKTDISLVSCAKDALSYLAYLRKELAAGRLPPTQAIYYGAAYQVTPLFLGSQTSIVSGKPVNTDRIQLTIKGPASQATVEMIFARDAARTLVRAEAPLAIGKFSMELAR